MKRTLHIILISVATMACGIAQHRLDVRIFPDFAGKPLAFDTMALETTARQRISVTRCDLLLSSAALRREDGTWITPDPWAAFISTREGRTGFSFENVPAEKFTGLRFQIGLPAETNNGDPAKYPAGHPLNPMVNGMHWSWQGGYVFAALEGRWKSVDGNISGYSYHLANDGNAVTIELPVPLDLSHDQTLRLSFHVDRIFDGLVISTDTATTHSRSGDPLVMHLGNSLSRSFEVAGVTPTPSLAESAARAKALISPDATPYRFTFPAGFPHPSLPADNPLTEEGVILGERLFHDEGLSGNGTQSCASCHEKRTAFSDNRRFSIGADGHKGTRQSMPLFNLAWKSSFFWDGRAETVRKQSLEPITNPAEMHATLPDVVDYVSSAPHYKEMFNDAFGSPDVDADRISRALEQFLLTLVSGDSKFDRSLRGQARLTEEEQRGATLFNTEYDPARGQFGADCFHCHGGPLFQSTAFANNGLDGDPPDTGRFQATKLDGDRGKFAVPSLRNIALTAPYMHDGRFRTLEEVIDHYDHGLKRSATLDPNLAKHPVEGLRLVEADRKALVAYLKTLTDHGFIRPGPPPHRRPPAPREL